MTEYIVKIGFCLRAYNSFNIEAASDTEAIEKAKAAAQVAMESTAHPEHIDMDEGRSGIIAFIDRITPDGRQAVIEDVAFDDAPSNAEIRKEGKESRRSLPHGRPTRQGRLRPLRGP